MSFTSGPTQMGVHADIYVSSPDGLKIESIGEYVLAGIPRVGEEILVRVEPASGGGVVRKIRGNVKELVHVPVSKGTAVTGSIIIVIEPGVEQRTPGII